MLPCDEDLTLNTLKDGEPEPRFMPRPTQKTLQGAIKAAPCVLIKLIFVFSLHTSTHGGSPFFLWFPFVALRSQHLIPTEPTFRGTDRE